MRAAILTLAILTSLAAAPARAEEDAQGWDLLALATVTEQGEGENWRAVKTFPPALEAAAEGFRISGYIVPVVPEPYLMSFLLVPDPANCPYCGDGGYGPVLEVTMARPLPDLPEGTFVEVTGRLEFNRSPETFQMFRLTGAVATGDF